MRIAKNFEMFCPDKVPQSIKVSTSNSSWSNEFILRFKESSCFLIKETKGRQSGGKLEGGEEAFEKREKKYSKLRHKLKFLVYVDQLNGIFNRSKLIMIQPYYIVKNIDESLSFAVTQFDLLDFKISIKPKTVITFNWPNRDSEEYMVIAQVESASNVLQTEWSRKFKIDMPGQFTVKCAKSNSFQFITINVYHEENSPYFITISRADRENLPLKFINETKLEIALSQVFIDPKKKREISNISKAEVVTVKPGGHENYTWDENSLPHRLKVQVEDTVEFYDMDIIKDLKPIVLSKSSAMKEYSESKHYLRGYLKRRNIYDDRHSYKEEYCILNFSKQVLKIYPKDAFPTVIKLQNAQIDEDFQRNEFMLIHQKESFYFQCKGITECKLWVNSLIKAKNLYQEDTVASPQQIFVKTEPTEYSRVITFYRARSNEKEEVLDASNQAVSAEQ